MNIGHHNSYWWSVSRMDWIGRGCRTVMAVRRPTPCRRSQWTFHLFGGRGESSGCPNQTPGPVHAYRGSGRERQTAPTPHRGRALPLTNQESPANLLHFGLRRHRHPLWRWTDL